MPYTKSIFNKYALVLGILPAVFFYLLMGLGPSIATAVFSFTDISGVANTPWKFIGLENYKEFFFKENTRDLLQIVRNTIWFCLAVTFLQNAIALPVALALNSRIIRAKNFFRAVIFFPVVLGVLVTSLVWMCVLNPMDGPVQKLLEVFGTSSGFFTDKSAALNCVIFTQIWMYMGYSMIINLAGLQTIPSELYEAGDMDGASRLQGFRFITFPMLWPTISANILLAIIGSLQSFQIIIIATSPNSIPSQTLASRAMYYAFNIGQTDAARSAMRQGYGAAWTMILFVFILAATLMYKRTMDRKELEI